MQIALILKLLDMIHDLLCPFFNDEKGKNVDYTEILNKLNDIQQQIESLKNGKS